MIRGTKYCQKLSLNLHQCKRNIAGTYFNEKICGGGQNCINETSSMRRSCGRLM